MKTKNDFFMSDEVKSNIKSRFEKLNGIYTKTLNKNGEIISYIARCECKDNDYVTVVHYVVENSNDKKNKYMAMAECIEKGDRYIKLLKKINTKILPTGQCICYFTEKGKKFLESDLYQKYIIEYENKFIERIRKYYKKDKNILLFYI